MLKGLFATQNILVILSGKGGVGKSTITAQLAVCMWLRGMRVGILDADFSGPSIPRILGLEYSKVHAIPEGWLPVYADDSSQRLCVMSIGFLLDDPDSAVIWRGPRKSGMIEELMNSVCWGQLDCLVIDTPPGTSDEHLSVLSQIKNISEGKFAGAVLVSTPQRVSLCDVRRELGFCVKTNLNVIGLIENMSGYQCPNCAHCSYLFSSGGAEILAKEKGVPFLGRLPMDPVLTVICDSADSFTSKTCTSEAVIGVLDAILQHCPSLNFRCSVSAKFRDPLLVQN